MIYKKFKHYQNLYTGTDLDFKAPKKVLSGETIHLIRLSRQYQTVETIYFDFFIFSPVHTPDKVGGLEFNL